MKPQQQRSLTGKMKTDAQPILGRGERLSPSHLQPARNG